jgi:uncharacterized membrane protein YgcG
LGRGGGERVELTVYVCCSAIHKATQLLEAMAVSERDREVGREVESVGGRACGSPLIIEARRLSESFAGGHVKQGAGVFSDDLIYPPDRRGGGHREGTRGGDSGDGGDGGGGSSGGGGGGWRAVRSRVSSAASKRLVAGFLGSAVLGNT